MLDKATESSTLDRLINIAEVSYMVGLKRATIYKRISEGKFPKPLKLGEKASRWRLHDIMKFIAELPQP